MRRLVWVYGAFIGLTVASFGVLSLLCASEMAGGSMLARALCGVIAVFWLMRLAIQLFVFCRPPFVTGWFRVAGYNGLTAGFAYLAVVYGLGAIQ